MLSLHLNILFTAFMQDYISNSLLFLLYVFQTWLRETYIEETSEYQL